MVKFRISILKNFNFFFNSKIYWGKPKKKNILIFDRIGSDEILYYIDKKNVNILDIRGESINVLVLIKVLFSLQFTLKCYINEYIKYTKPKFILTFIDNNPLFYLLKKNHPQLITIFIQNGYRSEFADIFDFFKNELNNDFFEVDFMLVFGNAIKRKYLNYISGESISIGSFINNRISKNVKKNSGNTILFISQYRKRPSNLNNIFLTSYNKSISWENFYKPEEFFVPLIHEYAKKNGFDFKICGCSNDDSRNEFLFYQNLILDQTWEFLPYKNKNSSYEYVDNSEIIVFIDSTLGYEALSRGKRVAAFATRGKLFLNSSGNNFGWPANLLQSGPFWTNIQDKKSFLQIMDYITKVQNLDWINTVNRYLNEIIFFDRENSIFTDLMNKLGIPLKINYK